MHTHACTHLNVQQDSGRGSDEEKTSAFVSTSLTLRSSPLHPLAKQRGIIHRPESKLQEDDHLSRLSTETAIHSFVRWGCQDCVKVLRHAQTASRRCARPGWMYWTFFSMESALENGIAAFGRWLDKAILSAGTIRVVTAVLGWLLAVHALLALWWAALVAHSPSVPGTSIKRKLS